MEGKEPCPFAKLGICRLGSRCKYLHPTDSLSLAQPPGRLQSAGRHGTVQPQRPSLQQRAAPPRRPELPEAPSGNRRPQGFGTSSVSEQEFKTWRRSIPLETQNIRPLLMRMSAFIQDARRLIETNASNLQSVVKSLASEGGLSRIQELVQQDFSTMLTAMKLERFQSQILPFLEIVSHP
ncbi:predicted protein [Aspergillus terreus NIH2624]|uniref:C3H1-type domain-containing protein n=1 Tax=Aspergillus terreus (strain NIH 2624 / FGSC A1156) TaxID=341663 RepID=Q0C8Z9_ASPTN|nr:uncharacterized protein ATEG_09835 [Aspergillus terreus NIH2624]EAU30026.1 predicted protein [Aspergillus terreus NIH2624]